MDEFLARLGVQAVNYAMRCGIALTSTFALQQCSRFLKRVDDKSQHAELQSLQTTLERKIKVCLSYNTCSRRTLKRPTRQHVYRSSLPPWI